MYKQIIVIREDLNMSLEELAIKVSQASMSFLVRMIKERSEKKYRNLKTEIYTMKLAKHANSTDSPFFPNPRLENLRMEILNISEDDLTDEYIEKRKCIIGSGGKYYECYLRFDEELYEQWLAGDCNKIILKVKNRDEIEQFIRMARGNLMIEGSDMFFIKDTCSEGMTPDEYDEDGVGKIITCIGFKPMDSETADNLEGMLQAILQEGQKPEEAE